MPVLSDVVRENQVKMVYNHLPVGLVAALVNGVLVVILHWQLVSRQILIFWLGAIIITTGFRFISVRMFLGVKNLSVSVGFWKKLLITGIVISGIIWGSASSFIFFHDSLAHGVLIAFVLGGMSAGISATYAALREAFLGFTIPALVPLIVTIIIMADPISFTMALMLVLFSVLISISAETNYKMIRSTFLLQQEKEDLIAQLTEEKNTVNSSLYNLQKQINKRERLEDDLRNAHAELEKKVSERTKELAEANEKLTEINSELSAFTHSVSHDLRAPLQSIDGLMTVLQEEHSTELDEEGKRFVSLVRRGVGRMNELIDDLLTLSKVSETKLNWERVNVSIIVEEIIENLRLRDPNRKIAIVIQPECMADCDPKMIRIALENLLYNSWKFTRKKDKPCIEFGEKTDEQAVFFVSDNGVGFDMVHSEEIFQPFRRFHPGTEFPGTGIGLATVWRIIRRHGGRIWARAAPGKGATFYFTLGTKSA